MASASIFISVYHHVTSGCRCIEKDQSRRRHVTKTANENEQDVFLALANGDRYVSNYPLIEANTALDDLRAGRLSGAAVLKPRTGGSSLATG